MQQWMLIFVNQFGYLGIFLLILIENIFPPIPSEAVLLFGGALTVTTAMNVPGTILAATAGSVLGAIVLYAFGRIFQAERLKRLFAGRFGQITKLRPEHVEKAESWFRRYQGKAVLICRCIPIVRSLISIPAGFAKMPMPGFLLLTTLGSAVWNTVLVTVGSFLGNQWENALPFFEKYSDVILVIAIILVVVFLIWWFGFRGRGKKADAEKE